MHMPDGLPPQAGIDVVRRGVMLALGLAWLPGCSTLARASSRPVCVTPQWLYAGTDGKGLQAFVFDPCEGSLRAVGPVADVPRPRWSVAHPGRPVLYVAVDGSGVEGRVAAYAVDRTTGALAPLNTVGAGGGGTTHLLFDAASNTLLAANFGGGSVAAFPVRPDGSLGERTSLIQATGSGPHRRQTSPHAHGVTRSPDGRFMLVPDLGADRVFVHALDAARHTLLPDDASAPRAFVAPAGSGPRRLVFGASGRHAYVLCELTAELLTLGWDTAAGRLERLQTTALSRPEFQGARSGSELAISRDGRFLYAADRGESTLLVYGVDAQTGALSLLQRISSGGELPWAFSFHDSGRWLLVANQRSNRIQVFRVDAATGLLAATPHAADLPSPISLGFGPV